MGYEISGGDMDFLLTIDQESSWNPKTIWDKGKAFWLCQWRKEWHYDIINDPRFKDGFWQVSVCYDFYMGYKKAGTLRNRLYGYRVRENRRKYITIVQTKNPTEVESFANFHRMKQGKDSIADMQKKTILFSILWKKSNIQVSNQIYTLSRIWGASDGYTLIVQLWKKRDVWHSIEKHLSRKEQ